MIIFFAFLMMVYPALNQWAGTPVLRSLGVVEGWLAGDVLKNFISRLTGKNGV